MIFWLGTWSPVTGASTNTQYTAVETIQVTGVVPGSVISINAGGYSAQYKFTGNNESIDWNSYENDISANGAVQVRLTSANSGGTTVTATVYVDGVGQSFSVTTAANEPDPFTFTDLTNKEVNESCLSEEITITSIDTSTPISISGSDGKYSWSNNGGYSWSPWTSNSGTINNNFMVRLWQHASSSYGTTVSTTLTIASTSDTWSVTTRSADTTPNQFTFTDVTNKELSTLYESNAITVAGIDAPASISISGNSGEYAISTNGGSSWGSWTSGAGTVSVNNQVKVRQYSSGSYSTQVDTTLNIGGVTDTYSVTTKGLDTTPDQFTFTDVTNKELSTLYESNAITVTGIEAAAAISISGNSGEYAISTNGGSSWGSWTSGAGTVSLNNQVKVRHTSSPSYNTALGTTLTIGGVSDTFTITTRILDILPDPFTFTPVTNANLSEQYESNSATIAGIDVDVDIRIESGEYAISTNGGSSWGSWTSGSGTASVNNQVKVRRTSSNLYDTAVSCTLFVGDLPRQFLITTKSSNLPPTEYAWGTSYSNSLMSMPGDGGVMAVDESNVYNFDNERKISVYSRFDVGDNPNPPTRLAQYGLGFGYGNDGHLANPVSMAIDDNTIYVADPNGIVNIQMFNKYTGVYLGRMDPDWQHNEMFGTISDIRVDGNYLYYIDGNHLDDPHYTNLIKRNKTSPYGLVSTFSPGLNPTYGSMDRAVLHVDDQYLYVGQVAGWNNQLAILVINKSTFQLVTQFGTMGTNPNQFTEVSAICTDDNYIFVADYVEYTPGQFVSYLKVFKKSDYSFYKRITIGVQRRYFTSMYVYDGKLYVNDDTGGWFPW